GRGQELPAGNGHGEPPRVHDPPLAAFSAFTFAFSSSTFASVLSGSASAVFWHPLQQMNTGWPLISSLIGGPISPTFSSVETAHQPWASIRAWSSGEILAAVGWAFGCSAAGGPAAGLFALSLAQPTRPRVRPTPAARRRSVRVRIIRWI